MSSNPTTAEHVDRATVDVAELCPKLRDGLTFSPVGIDAETEYRVHDRQAGRFYEVGYAEYSFLSMLDGDTSVAEAVSVSARSLRDEALTLGEVTELVRWAASVDLFDAGPKPEAAPSPWTLVGAVNPLWMKLPLPSPERVLDVVTPFVAWTQSRQLAPVAVVLGLIALIVGGTHFGEIRASFAGILAVSNWLPLAVVWTLLKLWHELGHALACRRYGVNVPQCGIVFILLAPCPYVDATASWSLRSKWQRVHIAAAGMIAELSVAALVVIAWPWLDTVSLSVWGLDPTWTRQLAANALFSATVATLLFNANPLMKFDGYYVLSDATGTANLASRGAAAAKARLCRVFFGERTRTPEPGWIECYGWAASVWRVVVTVSLAAAASVIIPGVGFAIGLLGAFASFVPPIVTGLRSVLERLASGRNAIRPVAVGGTAAALMLVALTSNWPFSIGVSGVVVLPDQAILRAEADGFVRSVPVSLDEAVDVGVVVVELENDELASNRRALAAEIDQSIARQRMLDADLRLADAQQEAEKRRGMWQQAALWDDQIDRLTVTAQTTGRVAYDAGAHELIGTFVREGDEIAALIGPAAIEIDALVPHRHVELVRGREGESIVVVTATGAAWPGRIERLAPAATDAMRETSLGTPFGGPIAVRSGGDDDSQHCVEPHFPMTVICDASAAIPAGMRVSINVQSDVSVAHHVWGEFERWWESLVRREISAR